MTITTKNIRRDDILTLTGKTRHGQNRIAEIGARWRVLVTSKLTDEAVLIESLDDPKEVRWITLPTDRHFEIDDIEIDEAERARLIADIDGNTKDQMINLCDQLSGFEVVELRGEG